MTVNMIGIAFCDDDLTVLDEILGLMDQFRTKYYQQIEYSLFHSPLELLAEIKSGLRLDVLVLDVIMPGADGISVAREIRQYDEAVKIIFLASSSEFALEAYTVGAYFYQMKPVSEENLYRLLRSVISECEKARQYSLILHSKSGITRIHLDKLLYCEVVGRNLMFHLENGKVLESVGSMNILCSKLASYKNFLHPHRSFLVNMEFIQNISYRAITMDNHVEIPIPHGKCSQIKNQYLEYAFSKRQIFML